MSACSCTTFSEPASADVMRGLSRVARAAAAADPSWATPWIGRAFPVPAGDPRYVPNALLPGGMGLEVSFTTDAPGSLRFDFVPGGPMASPNERVAEAASLVRAATDELDRGAIDGASSLLAHHSPRDADDATFGAFAGCVFDAKGLAGAKAYLAVDDARCTPFVGDLADAVAELRADVPGVELAFVSVVVGRDGVRERVYLRCTDGLRLSWLHRAADRLGAADQYPALVVALLGLAGGDAVVPSGAAMVSLSCGIDGGAPELKVEALAEAVDGRGAIGTRLMHAAAERGCLIAFTSWLAAVAEDRPLAVSVVGARLKAAAAPAITAYLHPAWAAAGRDVGA